MDSAKGASIGEGIEERVKGLIKMAEGGPTPAYRVIRRYIMGVKWKYTVGDSLFAIQILGNTKSQRALDYLRSLISEREFETKPLTSSGSVTCCKLTFPGAGRLSNRLYLKVVDENTLENVEGYAKELADSSDLKVESSSTARVVVSRTYQDVYDAIKTLEAALQSE